MEENKIINIEEYKDSNFKLTKEDLLTLFITYAYDNIEVPPVSINLLMQSFGKYYNMPKFKPLFASVELTDGEIPYVDLTEEYEYLLETRQIILRRSNPNEFLIMPPKYDRDSIKLKYPRKVLDMFLDLMFYIIHDFKFGLNGWTLCFEDEYIKVPNYPGIVTGEFIDKPKTKKVMEEVKKRARKKLKDDYE